MVDKFLRNGEHERPRRTCAQTVGGKARRLDGDRLARGKGGVQAIAGLGFDADDL